MKKIIKYYWPLVLGVTLCLLCLFFLKSKNSILDQTVVSNMIDRALVDKALKTDYLIYLIKLRGSQLFLLLCMKLLKKEKLGLNLWLWITGIGIGVGAFYLFTTYHIKGLVFLIGLLFPHYFLYLYACLKYQLIDHNSQKISEKRHPNRVYIVKKLAVLLVVIIGLMSEYYVNPFVLNFFKKIISAKNYNI